MLIAFELGFKLATNATSFVALLYWNGIGELLKYTAIWFWAVTFNTFAFTVYVKVETTVPVWEGFKKVTTGGSTNTTGGLYITVVVLESAPLLFEAVIFIVFVPTIKFASNSNCLVARL